MNVHAAALAEAHRSRRTGRGVCQRCHRQGCRSTRNGCRRNISMTPRAPNCSNRSRCLPEYYPTRTELRHPARSGRRDRVRSSPTARAGGVRRRRHHQGPAAAGAVRVRRLCPGRHIGRFPQRPGRRACAGISPTSTSIRSPPISPRRSPCPMKSRPCRRSDSSPARRLAISSRTKPARSCAAPARSSAQARTMLIGVDLEKDERSLYDAYNDAAGVTARFNLNVMVAHQPRTRRQFRPLRLRPSRDLQSRASPHRDASDSRKAQTVRVLGRSFSFRPGESIHTESSYKYSLDRFTALARGSGWTVRQSWTDAARMFSVHALVAVGLRVLEGRARPAASRTMPVLIVGIHSRASAGITSRLQIGDSSMPPTMTQASGCCTCEPMPVESAAGTRPMQADKPVMKICRIRVSPALDDRGLGAHALVEVAADVGDQQDAVHRRRRRTAR